MARGKYKVDGAPVPSVTTITGRFKNSAGLIHWAWKIGSEGKDLDEERDKHADAGSLCHWMITQYVKGLPTTLPADTDPETAERARNGFQAFLDWANHTQMKILDTEMELVSRVHLFGGRPDAIAHVSGEPCIPDWKTGALYQEHLQQVAAYRLLWNENHPETPVVRVHLLRFAKESASFTHLAPSPGLIDIAERAFLRLRAAYEDDKILAKACG